MKMKTVYVVIVNIVFFVCVGILVVIFPRLGKPFMQGFYCDDTTIDKPYRESTVPYTAVYLLPLALAVVVFGFAVGKRHKSIKEDDGYTLEKSDYIRIVCDVAMLLVMFMYGAGITAVVTDVGKFSVGRLRPHYLSVCQPDWSKINCTDAIGRQKLIFGDKICHTTDANALKQAHLSFPSGHASMAAYTASFLILYLESQIKYGKWCMLPKYFIQALIGAAAFYAGLSRVTDYKHHPADVAAGFAIGIFIAVVMHCSLVKFYYENYYRKYNSGNSNDNALVEVDETPIRQ